MRNPDVKSICCRFSFKLGTVTEQLTYLKSLYFKLQNDIYFLQTWQVDTDITNGRKFFGGIFHLFHIVLPCLTPPLQSLLVPTLLPSVVEMTSLTIV